MMKRRRRGRAWQGRVLGMAVALGLGAGAADIASAQVNTEPKFVLSGVVIDGRGTARALLEEPQLTGGKSVMLRAGDMIGGYRLASVAEDHAVLHGPGGSVIRILLGGTPGAPTIPGGPTMTRAPEGAAPAAAPTQVGGQQQAGPSLSEEELKRLLTPPGPGEPRYRPASEGVSTPGPRPPLFDPEDFKRQVQQHLMGGPSR